MKKSIFIWIYIAPTIILTPIIISSINSWFSIWIIIEINLMRFISYIIFYNKFFKELSIKYFIIQAISSLILLTSSNSTFIRFQFIKLTYIILINLALLIKIGCPPFHNWFINIINNINWINCLILSTWQKIIPIISISYIYKINLIYLIIILSTIVGTITGINHQSIRLIIGFSSINHIRWIFINIIISNTAWTLYFCNYFLINLTIIIIFHKINIYYINQLYLINSNNLFIKFSILINFFSISGFPPIFGFLMKWISIYFINLNNSNIILIFIIIFSIISFFYYIRTCINIIFNFKLNNKIILFNKFNKINSIYNIIFFSTFINLWRIRIWLY